MLGIIILSIIQGIAEFLPISSSAHLIIFRDLFMIGSDINQNIALAFDVALHFGTLMAILVYFYKDFLNIFIKGITKGIKDNDGKILWFIIIATIPAAIAGLLFEDIIENVIRGNFYIIVITLVFMGIFIYMIDIKFKKDKTIKDMSFKNALFIGCCQIFALIPGFSRSGTTIAAGRIMNLNREDSAKFSFYLAAPIILGAVILTIFKTGTIDIVLANSSIFIIGILVSFIVGLLCIEFLLQYIRKHNFKIFMWYRIIFALIIIGYIILH